MNQNPSGQSLHLQAHTSLISTTLSYFSPYTLPIYALAITLHVDHLQHNNQLISHLLVMQRAADRWDRRAEGQYQCENFQWAST